MGFVWRAGDGHVSACHETSVSVWARGRRLAVATVVHIFRVACRVAGTVRLYGVELVAPTAATCWWLAVGSAADGKFWSLGATTATPNSSRGIAGVGIGWAEYRIEPWWWVVVSIATLAAFGASTVASRERVRQSWHQTVFVGLVSLAAYVSYVADVGEWTQPLPALVAAVPAGVAWWWVLRSPIDRTARGFRRHVRLHRLHRLWSARVLAVSDVCDWRNRVSVTQLAETGVGCRFDVRTVGATTSVQIADDLCRVGPNLWGAVEWADGARSGIGPDAVKVTVDASDATRLEVHVRRGAVALPGRVDAPPVPSRVTDGVPFGVTADGRTVSIPVFESHVLVAGLPGSGKSVGLRGAMELAVFALDAELWAVDLKRGVELAPWASGISRFAATPDETTVLLAALETTMNARLDALRGTGAVKITPSTDTPVIVLVVDEFAELSADQFRVLRRILSLGRAAGVSVWAATQRPSGDLIPTSVRALFSVTIGYRLRTPTDSNTVLGSALAGEGVDASKLPAGPGSCWVVKAGRPVMVRTFWREPGVDPIGAKVADRVKVAVTPHQFDVARWVAAQQRAVTVADIAEGVGRDRSGVHRTVTACVKAGVLRVHGSGSPLRVVPGDAVAVPDKS